MTWARILTIVVAALPAAKMALAAETGDEHRPNVLIIMCDQLSGWGQVLGEFFTDRVTVVNHGPLK